MAIDASIALQSQVPKFDDPLTVQSKRLQLSDLVGRQQMQQMQMQTAQREQREQQTLADLWRESGGDPTKTRELLATRGLGSRIPAFDKAQGDLAKDKVGVDEAKLKIAKQKLDIINSSWSSLAANQQATHQDAINVITGLVQQGVLNQAHGAQMVQALPGRPEMLRPFLIQKGLEGMDAAKRIDLLLPKTEMQDQGGARQVFSIDQISGTVTPGATFAKSATPGEVMTDSRTRAEGAANRANQVTLANLRETGDDRRSAATIAAGKEKVAAPKPMPAPAVKLQNEELSALGTFAGLDADIAGLETQLASGKLAVGPVKNLVNRGRNAAGMSSEESRNFATLKSKMENMRNAVLLLNKGVQTEGDAQRAMDEIISNLNDPGVLKQRLAEVRALNKRAVELRKNNVDLLRSNYGHEPADFSKYETQPAATNLGADLKPGHVEDGYVYLGGDKADPKNWKKK